MTIKVCCSIPELWPDATASFIPERILKGARKPDVGSGIRVWDVIDAESTLPNAGERFIRRCAHWLYGGGNDLETVDYSLPWTSDDPAAVTVAGGLAKAMPLVIYDDELPLVRRSDWPTWAEDRARTLRAYQLAQLRLALPSSNVVSCVWTPERCPDTLAYHAPATMRGLMSFPRVEETESQYIVRTRAGLAVLQPGDMLLVGNMTGGDIRQPIGKARLKWAMTAAEDRDVCIVITPDKRAVREDLTAVKAMLATLADDIKAVQPEVIE